MTNNVLCEMIRYFGDDVECINHALKVYGFSKAISSSEKLSADCHEVLTYSTILHDIGVKEAKRKYDSTAPKYQEVEGPPVGRRILQKADIPENIIRRVCYLIGNHHSYNKIDGIDFQILVESDFIVNIFESDMDKNSITSVSNNIFKTNEGKKMLETMYLTQ